jgi:folylpolyglutamate synthase
MNRFERLKRLCFSIYLNHFKQIDVAIVEVGIGGEYDCTNIIKFVYCISSCYFNIIIHRTPIVCGITSLGLDHVKILGNTIEQIAWQKAGIFKKGIPAVTVPQVPEAMRVLIERAEEKHVRGEKY